MAYTFNQRRVPEFFKVYLPEHSSESLLIPNAFVTLCNRLMPKNAVLINHMGSLWHVIVDYIDGRVYFLNGWKKFVKDNSIESEDLLIFRYNGQFGFNVKVFGQDACEKIEKKANETSYMNKVKLEDDEEEKHKEEAKENDNDDEDCDDHDDDGNDDSDYLDYIGEQEEDSYMNKVKFEKDEVEKEKDEETKENGNDDEDCDDHDSDDSDYGDYIGKQEKEEDSYMNKVKLEKEKDEETKEDDNEDEDCDDHDSYDCDYNDYIGQQEEEEDSTKEEEAFKNSRAGKQSVGNTGGSKKMAAVKIQPGSKRTNPINIEEEEESTIGKSRAQKQSCGNNGVFEQMSVNKNGRGYKRTNDVSLEEVDTPKIILPQNPHFIAKLKAGSSRNLLFVPARVLKLSQLKLQNSIFFRNKRGMQWPGDVINQRNNQTYIRGWNDFCMANHVSMHDWCLCEFPQGNNQEVNVIDVHIIHNTGEGASRKQRALNKNG
ncbi:hypothetical protein Ddye_027032 [Dipteronia dyeriana]|uniref:TF-B3 domain-containing protein n=1 Tax=Dipteronia dyeriana TaxID=168575 RepID=A0AAD9TNU2_9ROSI|nr:hypothetical protein Ddye_027032 [Dipteronia dyeriana]